MRLIEEQKKDCREIYAKLHKEIIFVISDIVGDGDDNDFLRALLISQKIISDELYEFIDMTYADKG